MTCNFLNEAVSLVGVSRKGKDRVKRDGANGWRVTRVEPSVQFSTQRGPWLFIENGDDKASRWVHGSSDADFEVIIEKAVDPDTALQSQIL